MCSTIGEGPATAQTVRSFAELAEAPVDAEWLSEVVRLLGSQPTDGAAAAAALRVFARAETVLAAARVRATKLVAFLADARTPELWPELDDWVDPAKLPPSTAELEVAAALRISAGSAHHQIEQARLIHAMPGLTAAKLARGETSVAHVRKLLELARTEELACLLAECEAEIWRKADQHPDWTPPQLKRAAARIMARHEPEQLRKDHDVCAQDSDVTVEAEPESGMAWVHAYLPALDAATIKTAVDAAAAAARAAGDRRPIGMLRTEALTACVEAYLLGQPVPDGMNGPAGAPPPGSAPGQRPHSHGRPVEIQVVAPLGTVLGLVDLPGELPGNGLIPADVVRDLAREAKLRLVTYDPATGTLLDYGQTTYRPPAALAAKVAATWQTSAGIGSNRPAIRCDLDHLDPYGRGGPTSDGNLIPLDRRNHRIRTHDPALSATRDPANGRLTWTTPFGQTVETYPYDWRLGP